MILPKFSKMLTLSEQSKVLSVCKTLGISPNWLLAVMYFETGGTLSPTATNKIGSVGLIQFTRDKAGVDYKTIKGKRYALADIKRMSFIQQMDLVLAYFQEVQGIYRTSLRSFIDVYFAVFFPLAIGRTSNYVLKTGGLSASLIAKQNPVFDKDKNGSITVSEVTTHFANYYGSLFDEIKKKVLLTF